MTTLTPKKQMNGYPEAKPFFDHLIAILSILAIIGLFIDGWAHNHGAVDNTFFTIYHAVLYGSYGLIAITMALTHLQNVSLGYKFTRALPRGYNLSMIGVLVFAVGGVGDAIWHEVFGFEENIEQLVSPTHLILFSAYIMMLFGSVYARWSRKGDLRGWRQLWDIILLFVSIFSTLTFALQYAHYLHALEFLVGTNPDENIIWMYNEFGIVSFNMTSSIFVGIWLFMTRRWVLPFGTITFLLVVNTFLMAGMVINRFGNFPNEFAGIALLMGVIVLGSFICDIFVALLKPSPARLWTIYLSAAILPTITTFTFIISVHIFGQIAFDTGLWWRAHTFTGVPVLTGCFGLFLALLMYPPILPDNEK